MMTPADNSGLVCRKCGAPLRAADSAGNCLVCMLEAALDVHDGEEGPVDAERFDHYELATYPDGTAVELGRGAMGVTYKAFDTVLGHAVALKAIGARVASRPEARERFLREARAAAQLRHPNVASVFYYGVRKSDGRCFYAMELVEGETVEARVRRAGPMPALLALELVSQIARALAAAEAHGLVHRDLKPANLMLVEGVEPTIKVIDFGLAKAAAAVAATETNLTRGGFVGTPAFASPEQFASGEVDARSDFFSLGATLWYMLCGKPPFLDRALPETEGRLPDPPLPIERLKAARVPPALIAFTRSLLAPDPRNRPQTAGELAEALRRCRQACKSPWRRHRVAYLSALGFSVGAMALIGTYFSPWVHRPNAREKSIAVLPFDNLTDDRDNAFFTAGIQEDIQANLAKVAELKVISQDSVQVAYRDRATRPVGQTLGVSYLLEGSVRRSRDLVRVTAQLIDVAADRQVWAERYDRDLSDVFTIQSDLAEQITRQLEAKLSAEEKATINEPPTRDITAYELYLRGRDLLYHFASAANRRETLLDSIRLLEEAVKLDSGFVAAFCSLSNAHDLLYLMGLDHTPTRRKLAETALERATHLSPDSGMVHYVRAYYFLFCAGDDEQAWKELEQARGKLPNDARIPRFAAEIELRRGLWEDAVRDMERAWMLNPLSVETLHDLSWGYAYLHRYGDAVRAIDRGLAAGLSSNMLTLQRAMLCFNASGDTGPLHGALQAVGPAYDPDGDTTFTRIAVALWDRDFQEAARVLNADTHAEFHRDNFTYPRGFVAGLIARAQGDAQRARACFEAVRPFAEQAVHDQRDDARTLSTLAQVYAGLGRTDDALRAARRAAEMVPVSADADLGTDLAVGLAQVYAWAGQRDLAFQQLGRLAKAPRALHYGVLKLDPIWDDLRGDARFRGILADLATVSQPIR
jgi:serine/threonine protein kinase